MLSPLRLTHLFYSRQSVNYSLVRTRAVLKSQPFATSASAFYASPKSRGKDKSGNDSTKESKLKEKLISTASLVPGSQKPIVNEAAREEYAKTESTMRTPVEWFRKECTEAESRANGRITPALLKPVRVKMDDVDGAVGLEQVATVGIRDGTTLIVTVFDEQVSDCCLP
jgi:ribosome recycling factor